MRINPDRAAKTEIISTAETTFISTETVTRKLFSARWSTA